MPEFSTDRPPKMRLICCIHSLAGGGAERLMAGLANRLAERHTVTLLTLDRSDRDRYDVSPQVERVGLDLIRDSGNPIQGAVANVRRVNGVRKAISQRKPDAVLSFCDQMNVVVLAATRSLRIPTVITEFTDPRHQKLPKVWQALRRALYPTAAVGVALNQSTLPVVQNWVRGPVTIISAAVDEPPSGFKHIDAPENRKILVGVGRLSREKGFDRLVKAFAAIAAEVPLWDLHLAGDGPDRTMIEEIITTSGLQSRIKLVGWLKNVWDFLATADAFALTSRYDGFPVALLEAMAGGIPVISVDCDSGPREIIRHKQNGWLVPNDDHQLAESLKQFLLNDQERTAVGAAGKEVLTRLSWQKFTDDYEAALLQAKATTTKP